MADKRDRGSKGDLQPRTQPEMGYDRLFNLMISAQSRGELFVIFDECENTFLHRDVHTLNQTEQKKLFLAARDELARRQLKFRWSDIDQDKGMLQ